MFMYFPLSFRKAHFAVLLSFRKARPARLSGIHWRFRNFYKRIQQKSYGLYFIILSGLIAFPFKLLADSNPWGGGGSGINPDDLQKTISQDTTGTLKTVSIVVGSFLLLGGVTVLYKVLSRDADEKKEHGNSVITILIAGLSSVIGLVLLGIAWKGLSSQI